MIPAPSSDPSTPHVLLTVGGRTTPTQILRAPAREVITADDPTEAVELLRRVAGDAGPARAETTPPARSGWAIAVSYDLGRHLEPAAAGPKPPPPDRALPLVVAARYDNAEHAQPAPPPPVTETTHPGPHANRRDAFIERTRAALAYIRAGDAYQVNLTERFEHPFDADHRALAANLFAAARPAHGCVIEWPNAAGTHDALISASPELFLSYDPTTRTLRTKPMKGTRPAATDPRDLDAAEKDRAELAMIVDLMRNDLTRVCRIPSVRVETPRSIDTHAGSVHQATATVAGNLRDDLHLADAILATFPPGSVTGAPKIRAMQIIDELETAPRGFYCGIAGWIDDAGRAELSVTIRAATITGAPGARIIDLHAGAGIVADSDPDAEWHETLLKTEVLRAALARTAAPQEAGA